MRHCRGGGERRWRAAAVAGQGLAAAYPLISAAWRSHRVSAPCSRRFWAGTTARGRTRRPCASSSCKAAGGPCSPSSDRPPVLINAEAEDTGGGGGVCFSARASPSGHDGLTTSHAPSAPCRISLWRRRSSSSTLHKAPTLDPFPAGNILINPFVSFFQFNYLQIAML